MRSTCGELSSSSRRCRSSVSSHRVAGPESARAVGSAGQGEHVADHRLGLLVDAEDVAGHLVRLKRRVARQHVVVEILHQQPCRSAIVPVQALLPQLAFGIQHRAQHGAAKCRRSRISMEAPNAMFLPLRAGRFRRTAAAVDARPRSKEKPTPALLARVSQHSAGQAVRFRPARLFWEAAPLRQSGRNRAVSPNAPKNALASLCHESRAQVQLEAQS